MKAKNARYATLSEDYDNESTNILSTKRPSVMKRGGDITNKFIEFNAGKK